MLITTEPAAEIAIDESTGTLVIRDARAFRVDRRGFCRRLVEASARRPGVREAAVDLATASCRVAFAPGSSEGWAMAAAFVAAVRDATPAPSRPLPDKDWSSVTAARIDGTVAVREVFGSPRGCAVHRLRDLALAGGSAAMTVIALVIPGVPTVPFLLATSYFLARSWPWLDVRLRRAPLFGQVIREWETHAAISRTSKRRLMGLTVMILLVTIAVTPMSTPVLAMAVVAVSISLLGIAWMPKIDDGPAPARRPAALPLLPA
jgi:hypothetical protein